MRQIVFVVILMIQGCADQHGWEGSITSRNGYTIIENYGKGVYESQRKEKLTAVKSIIGGGKNDTFAKIKWLEFDTDSNLYVLDEIDQSVTKVSPASRIITTFGRKGKGPGELLGCNSFVLVNKLLFFANRQNGRIEVFDKKGTNLPSIKLPTCKTPAKIYYHDDHFYVGELMFSENNFALYQYDMNWRLVDNIKPGERVLHPYDILRNVNTVRIANDGFWMVFGMDNRILKVDFTGQTLFKTYRTLDWLPLEENGKVIPDNVIHGACDLDPFGNLYVIYSNHRNPKQIRNEVYKYGVDGRLHGKAFVLPIEKATMIRFDHLGKLYFSDGISLYSAEITIHETE